MNKFFKENWDENLNLVQAPRDGSSGRSLNEVVSPENQYTLELEGSYYSLLQLSALIDFKEI